MSIKYDEKGNHYTEISSMDKLSVIIQTSSSFIAGFVHVRPNERVIDCLNQEDRFIAVTEAKVYDQSGEVALYQTNFLALNQEHIQWLMPKEEIKPTDNAGGNQ
ncbi:MAG: hypothetical protein IH859_03295 [Chloroflexi bacterium]|nr:hypothetical protein [Chloroflexota bacterium]